MLACNQSLIQWNAAGLMLRVTEILRIVYTIRMKHGMKIININDLLYFKKHLLSISLYLLFVYTHTHKSL